VLRCVSIDSLPEMIPDNIEKYCNTRGVVILRNHVHKMASAKHGRTVPTIVDCTTCGGTVWRKWRSKIYTRWRKVSDFLAIPELVNIQRHLTRMVEIIVGKRKGDLNSPSCML
jgi:hypothetical protein